MILETATILLLTIGVFFFGVGTIGLLRLPDVFTRIHATTKADTLGAVSIFLGLAVYSLEPFTALKMIFIMIFVLIANATAAHSILKAAYISGERPYTGTVKDVYGDDLK